jgi:antitoxin component of MazEF toxin-antitoxin module
MPVMLKSITKIGNSQGLIFDAALLELAGLKTGDQVNVTVHEGGTITLTPLRRTASPEQVTSAIRKTVKDYRRTLRRLA